MDKATLLLGAPGTGKTHALIDEILNSNCTSFAFLSFTRRAANEAKYRLGYHRSKEQLKYVRTIHSLCFELAGLKKQQVMNNQQLYKFANECGFELHPRRSSEEDGTSYYLSEDDINYRQMMIDLARLDVKKAMDNPLWTSYVQFMQEYGLYDYHHMLLMGSEVVMKGYDAPKFDLLLVDEFQDLTPAQLWFIDALMDNCKRTFFAADDNQMIFEWAGVDRQAFRKTAEECREWYLSVNHRLPKEINELAHTIALRQKDTLTSFDGRYSISQYNPRLSVIHATEDDLLLDYKDQYLFLARNKYLLGDIINMLEFCDAEWSWLDDEKSTNIKVSTIHGAKGAEADNVVLFTDVSPATYEHLDDDSEHRVWYVAVTRARKQLYIIAPRSDRFYDLE